MDFVLYQTQDRIAYITLNRPEKRNALNARLVTEIKQAIDQATQDEHIKIIILKANGQVFCAGADLEYIQTLQKNTYEENLADSTHLQELFYKIYTCPKVVIAQVHGHAIAGGCGLATVADISFTVPEAKFGYTEVRIGFIPAIVSIFLLRKIGEARSKELLLSGELISAEQAQQYGLINFITDPEALENDVEAYALQLVEKNSAQAMATTKQLIAQIQEKSLQEALKYASEQNALARQTADCKKGITSFLNKETPQW